MSEGECGRGWEGVGGVGVVVVVVMEITDFAVKGALLTVLLTQQ